MTASFLKTLQRNFRQRADHLALDFLDPPRQRLRYGELDGLVERAAAYLRGLGVEPGDRVALQLPKSLEFIALHLATLRLGAITLPLNPAYPPDELAYFLADSGAGALFGDRAAAGQYEAIREHLPDLEHVILLEPERPERFEALLPERADPAGLVEQIEPDTTALMIYTSGTTGRPKGAEITHGNLTANLEALHTAWGWQSDDVLLHVLPIFHVHGLIVALHGALRAGASTLLLRKFDARRTLEVLSTGPVTVFMAVPTIYHRLLAVPEASEYDLSGVRLFTSGSDRLPDEVFRGFQETFGHTLLERYGMTETGMNLSNPLRGERRMGSVGLPLPGVEARVVDPETGAPLAPGVVGEVQIRGDHVFKGYWRQPEKTAGAFTADGWLRTGDLGFYEADGYFTLQGRAKDLIITGGMNVYPPEVERVLAEHPSVRAVAVIGCPDPEWGERVVAVVVAGEEDDGLEAAVIERCRARLAAYKTPRAVHLVPELPRNAMGKVQKVALREQICGEPMG